MALVRKNLMVDPDRVHALARQRGLSESAAVREAVDYALAAGEVMTALRGLHEAGAFSDFERLYPASASEKDADAKNQSIPTRRRRRTG